MMFKTIIMMYGTLAIFVLGADCLEETQIDLKFIKEMYNKFKGTSEENIKIHVVTKFLEMLGYDSTEFHYEHPKYHRDGRADIAVKVSDEEYLYVEVKESNNKLSEKELSQLADYLFGSHVEWGILTNGKNFVLFNVNIAGKHNPNRSGNLDRIVFNIDIFNKNDFDIINFFKKESIFENKITYYFKDIAQFKALAYPDSGSSWGVYKGTLINFFKYYALTQGRYRDLNQIRIDEFEDFLKLELQKKNSKNGRKIESLETFNNKYSHIRTFFQTLKVKSHGFDEERTKLIKRMNVKEKEKIYYDILNDENISKALNFYDTRRDAVRNKVLFLFSLAYGLERSTLINLTTDMIKKNRLVLENRDLEIPPKLLKLVNELILQNQKNKIKSSHLFYTNHHNKYNVISQSQINYVFDVLKHVDERNPSWKTFSTSFIRSNLIKKLFQSNYSIEEIVYLTGSDLSSITKIIPYDEIIKQGMKKAEVQNREHPFYKFLY